MTNRFDDTVIGDRPDIERRSRVEGCKMMIAVHLLGLAVDSDDLLLRHMALDAMQPNSATLLNHLHAATNAQDRQPALLCQIEQGILDGVAFWGIAAQRSKIVTAGQHQPGNAGPLAQGKSHLGHVWE
ncbi:MAG: hypothetical protein WBX16_08770 [Candidatus Acidiferrales bacterium]